MLDRRRRWGFLSVTRPHRKIDRSINWARACAIFGNPQPPKTVWERQFDYFDDDLKRLARTPYKQMDVSDLWYYYHDLAYSELQPDLFAYLFPACLMDWCQSLMRNEPCSHGDSEFHYGVHHGNVFEKMLTPQQQRDVLEFFRDGFLERLDIERRFAQLQNKIPSVAWMGRFNSLGIILPKIDLIWNPWWSLDTPGRAIAALQYCSDLMYFDGDNPLFEMWGGCGPHIWENDSYMFDTGWADDNLNFLTTTLTVNFVHDKVVNAAERLREEPDFEKAQQMEHDLPDCQELIEERINELPRLLANADAVDWTV